MLPATARRILNRACRRSIATAIAPVALLCALASGQTNATKPDTTPASSTPQESKASGQPDQAPKKHKRKKLLPGDIVAAPIPISSPALGSGVVPVVGYIFALRSSDKISPPSLVGGAGLFTNNGSRAFAVGGQLFMKQDTYRATAGFFQGNLNYNLYGVGADAGNAGLKLPLKQEGSAFLGEVLRRVKWSFFLGGTVMTGHSVVTIRQGGSTTVPVPPDVGLNTSLTALGFTVKRDTRPNRFYPTTGTDFEFDSLFFAEAFGSKYSFQSFRTLFNKYGSLSKKQVLAYNAYFCATGGQPPFYGNCIYGTQNELRGYEAGRYLDAYMVATQLEYRLVLPWRFGVVAFGGVGGVSPGPRQFFRSNAVLPAGGGGVRFMLSKSQHVNLRADFAVGKNEHTFSMGVGEAF